jgi:hypothetical protein
MAARTLRLSPQEEYLHRCSGRSFILDNSMPINDAAWFYLSLMVLLIAAMAFLYLSFFY